MCVDVVHLQSGGNCFTIGGNRAVAVVVVVDRGRAVAQEVLRGIQPAPGLGTACRAY